MHFSSFVLTYFIALILSSSAQESNTIVKLCIVQDKLDDCELLKVEPSILIAGVNLECVPARDRLECMHKVKNGLANVVNLPSNEAYAARVNFSLIPLLEEKTNTEMFMYQAVAVVKSNLTFTSLTDLKGKSSCHTGYGRTAGWDIPISSLIAQGAISQPNCNDEFASVSGFFNNSCLPGDWSKDPGENEKLKKKYPNLCALCNKSCSTERGDPYEGYEGTLKCLTEKSADVAFTKFGIVLKFFEANPALRSNYSLLCSDGKTVNISQGCGWAARPNPLLMVHQDLPGPERTTVQTILKNVFNNSRSLRSDIVVGTLQNNANSTDLVAVSMDTKEYLDKANFSITMDKPFPSANCREKYTRFCVTSDLEKAKCQDLKVAAFAARLRPHLECIQTKSVEDCMKAVRNKSADLIGLGPKNVYQAGKYYNLVPMMSQENVTKNFSHYAVAVIKSVSTIKTLADLKGKKSCHTSYNCATSWSIPITTLAKKNLMSKSSCKLIKEASQYFSSSCAPNAPTNSHKLCSLCVGDEKGKNVCSNEDRYFGYKGAFRCLAAENGGDVAFLKHTTVFEFTDKKSSETWATNLTSSDFMLLCPSNEVKNLTDYETCNWGQVPYHQLMVSAGHTDEEKQSMRLMLIRANSTFGPNSAIFKMFGEYNGTNNVLFESETASLKPLKTGTTYKDVLGPDLLNTLEMLDCNKCSSVLASLTNLHLLLGFVSLFFRHTL